MTATQKSNVKKLSADVVVVGGGGGMVAAARAAESGVKVILLEKTDRLGGASIMAGGISSVTSKVQIAAGTSEQLKEDLFTGIMYESRWLAHPPLIKRFLNNTGVFVDWVNTKDPGAVKTFPEHRFVQWYGGTGFLKMLAKYLTPEQGVTVLMETRANKLLTDKNGTVVGVLASGKDAEYEIETRSVILSAGAFSRNREWLLKYFPDCFDHNYEMEFEGGEALGRFADGDGIRMAQEIGSKPDHHMDVLVATAHHQGRHTGVRLTGNIPPRPEVMLVNEKGKRFMAELLNNLKARTVLLQPDGIVYAVFDSDSLTYFTNTLNPIPETGSSVKEIQARGRYGQPESLEKVKEGLDAEVKMGCTRISNNLNDIAQFIGADPAVFKAEVEHYNSYCDKAHDDDFYKDPKFLRPVRKPPFYVLRVNTFWQHTRGGIIINENTEVINKKDIVIKGLYATGDNAGGWCSNFGYAFVTGLTWAFVSGYMAAESAYEYVRSIK